MRLIIGFALAFSLVLTCPLAEAHRSTSGNVAQVETAPPTPKPKLPAKVKPKPKTKGGKISPPGSDKAFNPQPEPPGQPVVNPVEPKK